MWRSEPQIPLASTRTRASSGASSSGSPTSSIWTSPGAWKVTARIPRAYERINTSRVAPLLRRRGTLASREGEGDGDREDAAGADHGLFDRDRSRDGRTSGG